MEESITTESPEEADIRRIRQKWKNLTDGRKQLKNDKNKLRTEKNKSKKTTKMVDIIRLNVGGEIIMTTRASLVRIPTSILAVLFNGRWEQKINNDINGNLFLDFNPVLFRHLLERLRTWSNDKTPIFYPPRSSSPSNFRSFEKMLKRLGLSSIQQSSNALIVMNVGGESITTRQKTLTHSKSPKLSSSLTTKFNASHLNDQAIFIDADPQLFRHLIEQLREEKAVNPLDFNTPSEKNRKAFDRMLKIFSLNRKWERACYNFRRYDYKLSLLPFPLSVI